MIKVDVVPDQIAMRAFENNIKELVKITGKPTEEILRQQGRLLAVSAAKHTERYGDKAAVGKQHKKNLSDDIRRVYKRAYSAQGLIARKMGSKAGENYKKYIRQRDTSRAQTLIDKANISQYYRGRRPKVITWDGGAANTRSGKQAPAKQTVYLVCEYPEVKRYIKAKQKHVGAAKHGWARAAMMLGHKGSGRGMPKYFARGHKTRGFGRVKGSGSKAELTISHFGNYGFSRTSLAGVFRTRTNAMWKDIDQLMKRGNKLAAESRPVRFARTKLIITK